ncbi:hypothetical protein [Aurantiacibacter spongiae]|uniref:Uncharacterized protein n=1 Tax=Aurantiacibacter spongiae TaxID=2488860 RepID=A0A3N5DH67_9SPHN|nr:hypothetical protein [Aurantiacibacter spongiae]RPF71012.1 hypothetical protein EG799_04830 [Aurantiacibacter spongiae]
MANRNDVDYSVLVGWTTTVVDADRLTLRMQSVTTPPPHSREDVRSHVYVLDRNQAVQLGNFLFELVDQTKPQGRRAGWFRRMFG